MASINTVNCGVIGKTPETFCNRCRKVQRGRTGRDEETISITTETLLSSTTKTDCLICAVFSRAIPLLNASSEDPILGVRLWLHGDYSFRVYLQRKSAEVEFELYAFPGWYISFMGKVKN